MFPSGLYDVGDRFRGKQIRGGGTVHTKGGGRTRARPMIAPAFATMLRPMQIGIELELKKIEAEAVRLAKNTQKRSFAGSWGRSSAD